MGGGQIAGQRLLEQIPFLGREGFAAGTEAHPAQVRELQREGLDLDLGGVKLGVAAGDLFAQPKRFGGFFLCLIDEALNGADDAFWEARNGLQAHQFSMQIHAIIITDDRSKPPREQALFREIVWNFL